ncbi:MAG: hypothetical protein HOE90_20195 [Bacteriovoracaceae bacterium]|jgi:hypothetical protein|nr:hypothetical protein [Bacteriovoracaceae bacterium]
MNDVITERYLILLKLDARSLFNRISKRSKDYMNIFVIKRTREHFDQIFKNKYEGISIDTLACVSREVVEALDIFYNEIDELRWYFYHTEDLPAMMEDYLGNQIRNLDHHLLALEEVINKELFGLASDIQTTEEEFELEDDSQAFEITGGDNELDPPPLSNIK